jgi:hypothetical protein
MSNEEWHRMQNSKNINEKIKKMADKKIEWLFPGFVGFPVLSISRYDNISGLYRHETLIRSSVTWKKDPVCHRSAIITPRARLWTVFCPMAGKNAIPARRSSAPWRNNRVRPVKISKNPRIISVIF